MRIQTRNSERIIYDVADLFLLMLNTNSEGGREQTIGSYKNLKPSG